MKKILLLFIGVLDLIPQNGLSQTPIVRAGSATGILKSNGSTTISAVVSSDIISLWSGTCNASSYLRGDGACNTPPGCIPGGSSTQVLTDSGSGICDSNAAFLYSGGIVTLGIAGSVIGGIDIKNGTSGTVSIRPPTGALGTPSLELPIVTGKIPSILGTLAVASGKTATFSNTITTTATDGSTIALGAGGTVTYSIASGTSALGTSAISSATCATVVTTSATGTTTTDAIIATFNADPTSTTGYSASASGMLTIIAYPTTNNVNFKVCNNTGSSITPGAVTLNWRVTR